MKPLTLTLAVAGMLAVTGCNPNSTDSSVVKVVFEQTATNSCRQSQMSAETNMPPGFVLQKSTEGKYRVKFADGSPVFDFPRFDGSKKQAIARAWTQYEYGTKERETKWEDVK